MSEGRNFKELYCINVNENKEQKNKLDYLSWAWAWAEVKKMHDNADFKIYETTNPAGWVTNYFSDGKTCWVKVGVMIDCLEHIITLPVMDYKNQSIPLEKVTSFDVNKAIMRCLAKACALHGLGLYIYAGEDLPEDDPEIKQETKQVKKTAAKPKNEPKQEIKQQPATAFNQIEDAAYKEQLIAYIFDCFKNGAIDPVNCYLFENGLADMSELARMSCDSLNQLIDRIEGAY